MNQPDRIYFLGNPYPNGHALKEFEWSGRIEEDESMWFDFHLKTENYYAEDETEDEDEDEDEDSKSNWDSKIVWSNYHKCILSSTYWGDYGIKINKTAGKAVFNDFIKDDLLADTFSEDDDEEGFDCEELAFGIYLLGHDTCANHRIKVAPTTQNKFDIDWSGKIALTYSGGDEFSHDFKLHLQNAEFDGFYYPKTWSLEKASDFFKTHFEDFDTYEFVDLNPKSKKREYKFKKK